jgi:hypothetical protein
MADRGSNNDAIQRAATLQVKAVHFISTNTATESKFTDQLTVWDSVKYPFETRVATGFGSLVSDTRRPALAAECNFFALGDFLACDSFSCLW